jgi:phage anti-repressor protein
MLKILENNRISGNEIYNVIESKDKNYSRWINRAIGYAELKEGKDFFPKVDKSTGGRPSTHYEFTFDAAKEICLLEKNEKGKKLRRWLIDLSNKTENLELITVKQAAFAVKVINCLKYIENQKEAYNIHQTKYIAENIDICNPKYIYSEFAKYRANIVGWDKSKVDEAINKYLAEHSGYNKSKIDKSNMQIKLSIIDIGEAVRVACLDILYSKDTDEHLANRFSILCKNLAKEMQVIPEKRNETNLFREKEALSSIENLNVGSLSE